MPAAPRSPTESKSKLNNMLAKSEKVHNFNRNQNNQTCAPVKPMTLLEDLKIINNQQDKLAFEK